MKYLDLLELFYQDPGKYALALQSNILQEYGKLDTETLYLDRCAACSLFVFCFALHLEGHLSLEDLRFLKHMYVDLGLRLPQTFVYVKTLPEVAFARMTGRGRNEESPVSLQYLQLIHFCYENFVSHLLNMGCQVVEIDGNLTTASMLAVYEGETGVLPNLVRYPVCSALTAVRERELNFGPGVSEELRAFAIRRFQEYKGTFAFDMSELGRTTLVEHHIDTGDARPIKTRPFRLPPKMKEELARQVDELTATGILEVASGAWALPAFLVPKKTPGKFRLVGDMRKLNEVTLADVYPLPYCEELVENMAGYRWYSVIDALSGFFQVPIAVRDRDKTTIHTPRGLRRYTCMCMGLRNSPSTWQRLMETTLQDLLEVSPTCAVQVFVDDVCIGTMGTFEQHIDKVCSVLERFQTANLTISAEKSVFGRSYALYLGSIVSASGIQPDPEKLDKVR